MICGMRKGQKLENYFRLKGYPDELHHTYLYYIEDSEFDNIVNMKWEDIHKKYVKVKL